MQNKLTISISLPSFIFTRRGVFVSATFRYEGAFEMESSPRNHLETTLAASCKFQLQELLHRIADEDSQPADVTGTQRRRRRQRQWRESHLQGLTHEIRGAFNAKGMTLHLRSVVNNILHPATAGSLQQRRALWKRLQRLPAFGKVRFTTKLLHKLRLLRLNSRRLELSTKIFTRKMRKHTK